MRPCGGVASWWNDFKVKNQAMNTVWRLSAYGGDGPPVALWRIQG
jgi:hypothetical protein